jgi:hypothetical protein
MKPSPHIDEYLTMDIPEGFPALEALEARPFTAVLFDSRRFQTAKEAGRMGAKVHLGPYVGHRRIRRALQNAYHVARLVGCHEFIKVGFIDDMQLMDGNYPLEVTKNALFALGEPKRRAEIKARGEGAVCHA